MNAVYIFLLSTTALETGLASFLDRIGIAAARRVRTLDRPGVLGLSASSYSSIGSICLYSRVTETARTRSTGYARSTGYLYLVVRLRFVDCLAFAIPIATIALPIACSPVVVFVLYIFRYYLILGRGLLRNQRASL